MRLWFGFGSDEPLWMRADSYTIGVHYVITNECTARSHLSSHQSLDVVRTAGCMISGASDPKLRTLAVLKAPDYDC